MAQQSYHSGLSGEAIACQYLKSIGIQVLRTRYRAADGEVDIVAMEAGVLCFIEVKHRPNGRLGAGLLSVDSDKRRRLRHAAQAYLASHSHPARWRFDTLEITRAGVWYARGAAQLQEGR